YQKVTKGCSQRLAPLVYFASRLVPRFAVAFLDLPSELLALAFHHVKIVVSEFAPLLLGLTGQLLPVTFDFVPVHGCGLLETTHRSMLVLAFRITAHSCRTRIKIKKGCSCYIPG